MTDEPSFQGAPKKHPIRVGTVSTVDIETGEVVSERPNTFTVLPPKDGCPECGVNHAYDQPHDKQSMIYQYQFYGKHGCWPTWTDALAHCPEPVRLRWRATLVSFMRTNGLPVPEDLNPEATITGDRPR